MVDIESILKNKKYKPVDRLWKKLRLDNLWVWILKLLLEELNFQQTSYLQKDVIDNIGKQLGAELMLVGSIIDISEDKIINLYTKIMKFDIIRFL